VKKHGYCESKLPFLLIAAMPCARSGALLAATVACPQESLMIVQGEGKKVTEKSSPKCSHSPSIPSPRQLCSCSKQVPKGGK